MNNSLTFKRLVLARLMSENTLVFLLQYVGLMFSMGVASGTALAFVFMRGLSVLPAIGLGTFVAFYFSSHQFMAASMMAVAYLIQSGFILSLSYRNNSPSLVFYDIKPFLYFIVCGCLLTALTSSVFAFTFHENVIINWLSNLTGMLVFAIAILTWDFYASESPTLKTLNRRPLFILFGLLFFTLLLQFINTEPFFTVSCSLFSFMLIIISARYFGWCGAVASLFLIAMMQNLGMYLNASLLETHSSILYLQGMLLLQTIVGLTLSLKRQQYRLLDH